MIERERPVFTICMPCHDCNAYIKKAIDSIIDQDEESWELICVVNGKWKGREYLKKIIEKYLKKDNRIKLLELEEGNACTARNRGAEYSSGKYISFFSSDFFMFPGALRKWKKEFEKRPKADFIYSGYKFMKDGKFTHQVEIGPGNFETREIGGVPTEDFDHWRLKMENYIDGGFPMKREVWEKCKWDPEVKSLNDWDFWLTVADNGFVGEQIPDITYAAELPRPGGLSYDSSTNWNDRVNYIKKKHKIAIKDVAVFSFGAPVHAKKIAKVLDADCFQMLSPMFDRNKALGIYKAVYLIGFYVGDGTSALAHSNVFKHCTPECKKVIHWIGTDVLQLVSAANKVCYADMRPLIDVIDRCVNISEFDITEGELNSQGISSKILPLPIDGNIDVMPLPKEFTVAIYAARTPTAKQIYNLDLMADIVKSCPDIKFLLFGGGLTELKGKNVENVGWCDMKEVMAKSSLLMRITYHDGLPIAPIEFRLAGRDAMTTVQIKHIWFAGSGVVHKNNYADRKESIISLLRTVKKEQKLHGVKEVKEAREYYLDLTSPLKFKKRLMAIIDAK